MSSMVSIRALSKKFGRTTAVSNLSLEVEVGTVLGLIGPNGAGKSTTLKILATLIRPDLGTAVVDGNQVNTHPRLVRRAIGYMPDVCGLYEDMLVHEYLRFFAAIYGIKGTKAEKTIDDVIALTGLGAQVNVICGALSRGLSQRVHLARVLLHDPKVLLLDEPASGLDPRARIEFKELVLTLRRMGKTQIISSHILSELGEMCDTIAIIENGSLVYGGEVETATRQVEEQGRVFSLRARHEPENGRSHGDLVEIVRSFPFVDAVRDGDRDGQILVRLRIEFDEPFRLNAELVQRGYKVEQFAEERARLEDAFLHLTRQVES